MIDRGVLIDRSTNRVELADGVPLGREPVGRALVGAGDDVVLGVVGGLAGAVGELLGVGLAGPLPGQAEGKSVAGELPVTKFGAGAANGRTSPAVPAAMTTAAATAGTTARLRNRWIRHA